MRKHRRRGGRNRFLIIIIIIIIAAAAALFRLAAGGRKSGEPGVASGAPDPVAAEGSTLMPLSSENPQASAGGPQSGPTVNSDSGISGQTASVQTSPESAGARSGTDTAPTDTAGDPAAPASDSNAAPAGQGTDAANPASDPNANPASDSNAAPAVQGTAAADGAAQTQGTGKAASTGADASSDSSTQAASAPKKHVVSELETGKAYLDSLDQRSPVEMEYRIDQARAVYEREQDRKDYLKKRELYRQTLEDDGVWDQFDKYVFLGDSRVVGYNVFGFLPEERVLAEQGDTILAISDRIDALKELDPSYIFISYGINDINLGIWPTADEYANDFSEKIDDLRKELPDAQVYVNSIIPATDEAVENVSLWGKIPEYSDALKKMCAEKGIPFIDNTKLMEEHKELYAGDGVHLLAEFYPYWAQNQLLGIYDLKNGRNSDGYKLGDKTGQAAGQAPADKDKSGEVSLEDPASKKEKTGGASGQDPESNESEAEGTPGQGPESNESESGGASGQDPASNKEKTGGAPGQNPANKSEAGGISGDAPVSNKDKTGTD